MKELIELIVKAIVDLPDRVVVSPVEGERTLVFEVRVDASDLGRVIGKGGRIANALRTVVKVAGAKEHKNIWVDLDKLPEPETSTTEEDS